MSALPIETHDAAAADDFEFMDHFDSAGGGVAGVANVIMQLSHPSVGYGVFESKVESGRADRHPFKRARTTGMFLACAVAGTPEDKAHAKAAIDSVHRHVKSTSESPVKYNAFDRDLQLWVAACLYRGTVDTLERFHGLPDERTQDRIYQHASAFATTLQVRPEMWPADRAAFAQYWSEQEQRISIDDTIRSFLLVLLHLGNLPWPLRLLGRMHAWVATGFLPPAFRDAMHLTWSDREEARHLRLMRGVGWVMRRLPGRVRNWPVYLSLWDTRRRVRRGLALV